MSLDRILASFAGLVIIGLAVFLLIRNAPITDPTLIFTLRVGLSFTVAVLGATIPGFLELNWSGRGLVIRAGGALALFVLTFVYTPNLLNEPPKPPVIIQQSSGSLSPPIVNNSGSITLQGAPPPGSRP